MTLGKYSRLLCHLAPVLILAGLASAGGEGVARIGYEFVDETGNVALNRETFNVYDGPGLGLENFRYLFDNGVTIRSNLKEITKNNRNLQASIIKPGLFSIDLHHNQYRRTYRSNGADFTRRETTGASIRVKPASRLEFFGGLSRSQKHGTIVGAAFPLVDPIETATDYLQTTFSLGGQYTDPSRQLRLEYRGADFSDDLLAGSDRQTGTFAASGYTVAPKLDWLSIAGGYQYRRDRHETSKIELTTNQVWASARGDLPKGFLVEYRLLAARSDQSERLVEIDNIVHTFSAGRTWKRQGGVKIGYERRTRDDIFNKTAADGVLLSGWWQYVNRLSIRGQMMLRNTEVTDGVRLVGEEELSNFRFSAQVTPRDNWSFTAAYFNRSRSHEDIDVKIDYDALTLGGVVSRPGWGSLDLSYGYYIGAFDNRGESGNNDFTYADHLLTGAVLLEEYRRLTLSFGGSYYRSRRDIDIEKSGLHVTAVYALPQAYQLEASYGVFNYDDYLGFNRYYTANIVQISLAKRFSL